MDNNVLWALVKKWEDQNDSPEAITEDYVEIHKAEIKTRKKCIDDLRNLLLILG